MLAEAAAAITKHLQALDEPSHAPVAHVAMGTVAPPVDRLKLVTPYPHALATNTELRLLEVAAGKPCVLHLFTG